MHNYNNNDINYFYWLAGNKKLHVQNGPRIKGSTIQCMPCSGWLLAVSVCQCARLFTSEIVNEDRGANTQLWVLCKHVLREIGGNMNVVYTVSSLYFQHLLCNTFPAIVLLTM